MRFPNKSLCMQAEPVKYLHAGMVQHGPDQIPIFFHRTAEGKVYPFEYGYRKASGSAVVRGYMRGYICAQRSLR